MHPAKGRHDIKGLLYSLPPNAVKCYINPAHFEAEINALREHKSVVDKASAF